MSIQLRKEKIGFIAIIVLYLGLAFAYSLTTPPFQFVDEQSHFNYARQWLAEGVLPVIEEGKWASAEAHQPPLYYGLCAALGAIAARLDIAGIVERSETAVFFYLSRWLSILGGVVTIWGTYQLARAALPQQWSLFPAAFVAFNPSFTALNSVINNDGFTAALCTLVLLGILNITVSKSFSPRVFFLTGLALGLGALTKLSALVLVIPLALAIAFLARRLRSWRMLLMGYVIAFGIAFAIVGWWYVRNWLLYHDPSAWGLNALLNPAMVLSHPPTLAEYPRHLLSLAETYWAAFGYIGNVRLAFPIYLTLFFLWALALLGLISLAARWKDSPVVSRSATVGLLLLLLAVLINLGAVFRYGQTYGGAWHGRYLFPTISAASILMTLGLSQVMARRKEALLGGVASGLLVLTILILPFYIVPLRVSPPMLSPEEMQSIENHVDVVYDSGARLLGYNLDDPRVSPGEKLGVTLYWQGVGNMSTDWTVFVHLVDTNEKIFGQVDSRPLAGNYLTPFWRKGTAWKEHYNLPVIPQAHSGLHHLRVGLYELETMHHAPLESDGLPIADKSARFGEVKVVVPLPEPKPQHLLKINFQDSIRFVGWDLVEDVVTLYWQGMGKPSQSYTVFAHLLDDKGWVAAQDDGFPGRGHYPTNIWEEGEFIKDEHSITAPPGDYLLEVGLYDSKTMKRLVNEKGEDRILLGRVAWTEH